MPEGAFHFSMFSHFTFSYLSCALAEAEDAVKLMPEEREGYSCAVGHYTMDELFSVGQDGVASCKRAASSSTALFYEAPIMDKTIAVSNLIDGWITLSNYISLNRKIDLYSFTFSDEEHPDARNALEYTDYSTAEQKRRIVYAMKDPNWIFCNVGDPLYFEDVSNYKRRRIKDRINKQILISYCNRLRIDVTGSYFLNPSGKVLRVHHWWRR